MRKIKSVDSQNVRESFEEVYANRLKEAKFRAGKASFIAQKIGAVLSRRMGLSIGVSYVPEKFANKSGKFEGYFAFISNGRGLRFNFLLGKSDILQSIDSFASADDLTPEVNIDLMGFNIVQVINIVVDVINGEWHRYQESVKKSGQNLKEARLKMIDMVGQWLSENPQIAADVENNRINYEDHTDDFIAYIRDTFKSSKSNVSAGSLQWHCREAIEKGLTTLPPNTAKKVPTVKVQPGEAMRNLLPDAEAKAIFDEIMDPARRAINMQEDYESDVRIIASGSDALPGMFVHGKAGVGKTQTVTDIFNEEGVKPVKLDSPIGEYKNFVKILNDYQNDEIILIDDNDSLLANEKVVGMLKKVLDMKPTRVIEINPPVKIPNSDEIVAGEIIFTSKIVFISNMTLQAVNKSPHLAAIKSRMKGGWHTIDYSTEELLSLIKERLYGFGMDIPGLTDKMREEVFAFVNSISPVINVDEFDYRTFNYALGYRVAAETGGGTNYWKRRTLRMVAIT